MRNLIKINLDLSEIWRQIASELNSDRTDICVFDDHCEGNYAQINFDPADEAVLVTAAKFINAHTGFRTMELMKLGLYDNNTSRSILSLRKQKGIVNVSIDSIQAQTLFAKLKLTPIKGDSYHWSHDLYHTILCDFATVFDTVNDESLFKWHDVSTYATLVDVLNDTITLLTYRYSDELMKKDSNNLLRWLKLVNHINDMVHQHEVESDSICYSTVNGILALIILLLLGICLLNSPDYLKALVLLSTSNVLDIDTYVNGSHSFHTWDSHEIYTFWDWCYECYVTRGEEKC